MNSKTALILLLVVAGAVGVYFALGTDDDSGPGPIGGQQQTTADRDEPTPDVPDEAETRSAEIERDEPIERAPVRQPVSQDQIDPRSFAQGFHGRATTPEGTPIEDVKVFLVEGQSKNIFTAMMLAQRGVVIPPVAQTSTDRLGKFEIGLEQVVEDKKYELRFVSDRFADATIPNLTALEENWVDVGDTKMARGATVYGRVTVQGGNGLPVADAEVSVRAPQTFPAASLSPVPGRERGITTRTDTNGNYRLENVAPGPVAINAVAPGFAKIERGNVQVTLESDTQIDFELPAGREIGGTVTDAEGVPIGGVKITAIAISSKTPMTEETRSDADGRFEVIGLTEGPFQLTAMASGFVKRELKPVMAGAKDERIVLERQGSASVRVTANTGRLIQRYDLQLKSYFKEQESYGHVPNAEMQRVFATDLEDGVFTMSGIDPGDYVFEVRAKGFAKTYSPPFTVALGLDPDLVEVRMKQGGTIQGIVVGHDGRPLSGVEVRTMPNFLDENPFTDMFGNMIPYKITKTSTRTDAKGRYRIKMLAPGTYQLKFAHQQHYSVFQKDHVVDEAQVTTIPDLRMDRGTVVSGTARLDGLPAGQVKVSLSSAPDPTTPGVIGFTAEAITDNEGRFVVAKRLPPGRYQARAARQTLPSPLLQVVDFAKTQQDFIVHKGQESHQLHFTLTSN